MEQKYFVMVSTEEGKFNMGAILYNKGTWLNNISIFVLRITCTLVPWVIYLFFTRNNF